MPDSLNRTNHESLASEDQLRKIADSWQTITIPSVILHSFDDSIVPYENAIYTDQHLKNAPHIVIRDDDINHFYPYKAPGRIVEALETLHQLTSLST
jgi:pimeloyl-ACP methyl ester carboxylesterase